MTITFQQHTFSVVVNESPLQLVHDQTGTVVATFTDLPDRPMLVALSEAWWLGRALLQQYPGAYYVLGRAAARWAVVGLDIDVIKGMLLDADVRAVCDRFKQMGGWEAS